MPLQFGQLRTGLRVEHRHESLRSGRRQPTPLWIKAQSVHEVLEFRPATLCLRFAPLPEFDPAGLRWRPPADG